METYLWKTKYKSVYSSLLLLNVKNISQSFNYSIILRYFSSQEKLQSGSVSKVLQYILWIPLLELSYKITRLMSLEPT